MLAWPHSGFSIHAATSVAPEDRAGLGRLLYYCARPAFSVRRLSYRKAEGLAVYEARDKALGERRLVMTPIEFIDRLARLIPPPRKNVVRYYGALGERTGFIQKPLDLELLADAVLELLDRAPNPGAGRS